MSTVLTSKSAHRSVWQRIYRCRSLYLMLLPAFAVTLVFHYFPMGGLVIAFKNYKVSKGIWGSAWVGMKWFKQFISNPYAGRIIRNTFLTGSISFAFTFPAPILLALLFNEIGNLRYKKLVQTVSYVPHFISTVIIVGMLKNFTSRLGMINNMIAALGGERILFFTRPEWFRTLYVVSALWQGLGWGTIIYLAAITGISGELYEAAMIDGANRLQRIWHITLPGIRGTIVVLLIMNLGKLMGSNYERLDVFGNTQVKDFQYQLAIYIYDKGLASSKFSMATAVGLFQSLVGLILVLASDRFAKFLGEDGLL